MSSNYILISFFDGYDKLYEKFSYVFILVKSNSINFNINDSIKYKVFKVSEFHENYDEVISILLNKLPFKFEQVSVLDKKQELKTIVMPKQVYLSMENKYDPSQIQLVVAYYNEDLSWIEYLRKECCIDNVLLISKKHKLHSRYKLIHLDNVGKDAHSLMYYIVNNYENLPKYLLFCPGSILSQKAPFKIEKFKYVINNLHKVDSLGIVTIPYVPWSPYAPFDYDFIIDRWGSSDPLNMSKNLDLKPAKIRPFGKWYETYVDTDDSKIKKYGFSYNFIFFCNKQSILKKSKCFYKELLTQLSIDNDLEAIHYVERIIYSLYINDSFVDIKFFNEIKHVLLKGRYIKDFKKLYSISFTPMTTYEEIPQSIHFIWIGSDVPKKYIENIHTYMKKNPKYTIYLWIDHDITNAINKKIQLRNVNTLELINSKIYQHESNFGAKADILRYEIIFQEGGMYMDIDSISVKAFDENFRFSTVSYIESSYNDVSNAFFTFPKQCAFLKFVIDCLSIHYYKEKYIPWKTGPNFFTSCLYSFGDNNFHYIHQNYTIYKSPVSYTYHTNDHNWW